MNPTRLTIFILIIVLAGIVLAIRSTRYSVAIIQPLPFNHNLHVVEEELDCDQCHEQVATHFKATLPSITVCMTCHEEPMTETDIETQLLAYTSNEQEIPWQRIYSVPDHVYFSHRRHVKAGKIACERCHGPVPDLNLPPKQPLIPVTMDLCMDCHEKQGITNDCLSCHR